MSHPAVPADWLEGDVRLENGIRLRYYRAGGPGGPTPGQADRPPVVLVHGFTDNALYWTRTAQALAAEWDVVMYDARGHGKSDRAGGRFGDAERVGDLVGFIRALGLQTPALVGHSMGAGTAALAAAQHPGLARRLVLEDPAWREPPPLAAREAAERATQYRAYVENWRDRVAGLQAGSREFGLAEIQAHSPGWSEIDQNLSLNARLQVELDLFNHFPTEHLEWRTVVPKIDCPVLLLLGDNRERNIIVTPEQAEEAARLWRNGRARNAPGSFEWVVVEGAGHAIRYDRFERYLEIVQAFLGGLQP
jgi:pimeloyl-ACP methyl ester carboxylesterase